MGAPQGIMLYRLECCTPIPHSTFCGFSKGIQPGLVLGLARARIRLGGNAVQSRSDQRQGGGFPGYQTLAVDLLRRITLE